MNDKNNGKWTTMNDHEFYFPFLLIHDHSHGILLIIS